MKVNDLILGKYKRKLMKKVILLFAIFLATLSAFAQDPKTKENEKKSEEDPLKKAEAAFDKALDGLFKPKKKDATKEEKTKPEAKEEKPKPESKEDKGGGFGGFSFGGKPKASYSFGSSMTMKMTMKNAKDKEPVIMRNKYLFGDDGKSIGIKFMGSSNPEMQKGQGNMDAFIMDFDQNKMFTFMNSDGRKTLMAMGYKPDPTQQAVEKEPAKVKITKSGEVKTILGYKCDGYWIENEERNDKILMWISQNRVGEMAKMSAKLSQVSSPSGSKGGTKNYMSYYSHPEMVKMFEQGRVVLGYSSKSDKGDTMDMEVEEIKPSEKSSFETGEYKSMF